MAAVPGVKPRYWASDRVVSGWLSPVTAVQPDSGVQSVPSLVTGMTIRGNKLPVSLDYTGWYPQARPDNQKRFEGPGKLQVV